MKENRRNSNKIVNIISFIILCTVLYFAYQYYQTNNFNDFVKSETNLYTSKFKRDSEIKYNEKNTYKIESTEYNDAMFYQNIKVEKNQPYKVTCMVKTNNVVSKEENSGVGAQISIEGSTERSIAINGTQDWQKIEFIFNAKDREEVNIGFRLGGYLGEAKGEAWFAEFTIEEGIANQGNEWKFACFMFGTTDVNINGKQIKLDMTLSDISNIKDTIRLFQKTCSELSEEKMLAKCDIFQIDTPLSKLSYDDEFGYFVSPEDVENQIKETIATNDYDHIFVVVRLGNEEYKNEIQINDWIGLGSMDYYGIGFSNIRLPNDSKSYIYKYDPKINTFPQEVLLHEFLHSLERTSIEYGYDIPALHDYQDYGYKNESLIGQKNWYKDYMNKNVNTTSKKIGLPEEVYTLKPAKNSDFKYTYNALDAFYEPENIIEEIRGVFKNLVNKLNLLLAKNETSK